ncbi:MAG: hypothetical protein PHX35_03735 [Candidatus Bipolaricaulis anaerobius]|jgi:hypothetical protein|nr:hypothetical protein [Candidatus Bipolaricaulis anaerobius]MDD3748447.1 hypothetical protein [Candidatus Bipolaricaulis anaerobius]HOD73242.1 hypothetical protein [Candidatus Bipolaricaulis anaerobius]HQM37364.1 hypothetical protein [Candidatus Bipolaricaulis anaerobius]
MRWFLLAIGTALLGVVIGNLLPQLSTPVTVVLFAGGIVLIILPFLGSGRKTKTQ